VNAAVHSPETEARGAWVGCFEVAMVSARLTDGGRSMIRQRDALPGPPWQGCSADGAHRDQSLPAQYSGLVLPLQGRGF
jgi:hypothetical protein